MLKFLQDYGLPISLSEAGPGIDEIIVLSHWLMLVLFVGWGAFFIISLVSSGHQKIQMQIIWV